MKSQRTAGTQTIDVHVRVRVDLKRMTGFVADQGFSARDAVTLVRNEIESNLQDQDYVDAVEFEPVQLKLPFGE